MRALIVAIYLNGMVLLTLGVLADQYQQFHDRQSFEADRASLTMLIEKGN
jgi:hypothetical protein